MNRARTKGGVFLSCVYEGWGLLMAFFRPVAQWTLLLIPFKIRLPENEDELIVLRDQIKRWLVMVGRSVTTNIVNPNHRVFIAGRSAAALNYDSVVEPRPTSPDMMASFDNHLNEMESFYQ